MPRSTVVSRIAHDLADRSPSLLPPPPSTHPSLSPELLGAPPPADSPALTPSPPSARAPAPGSPWWEHLAADFSERDEAFELALRDSLQVRASAASDVVLRSVAASMVGALALPLGYHPLRLRSAERDRAFYGPIAAAGDARRFFRDPPKGVRVRSRRARFFPGFDPEDGEAEELSFDSPFVPVNPAQHRDYLKHRHNRTAHARLWRHRGSEARPTIMAIHGFTADLSLLNEWFFALPWFYRMGCDVLLFTLPFHGARRMNGSLFSGHGYFAGGPSRINEAVAQSVMDFRIFRDWLEQERGVRQVGVTGVSLGGFTTAAIATVEERLCFAIPNVPVISLADLVLEWEPMGTVVRSLLRLTGRRIEDARHMLAASCPLSYAPALARERLMIVGGVGDRLAPPKHSRILWDHWGRCRIHWFPGSHLLHLDRGDYLRQIARFLAGIGFLPRPE